MISIQTWIVSLALGGMVVSMAAGAGLEKKLINFGWDMMSPAQLAEKIGELQHLPFDGLTVRATNFCYPFYSKDVDAAAVEARVQAMSRIQWGQFTDNFMYLTAADNVDWFDEVAWADDGYILQNVRAIARMGRAGGCKGILFDPEFVYWGQTQGDPWKYQTQASREKKSIAEYRARVRQRGAQFINAIEAEMPNPVFLTLFWGIHYTPVGRLASETDPEMADQIVAEAPYYGLLHDFMLGILAGADKGTVIVDGNEASYYTSDWEGYNNAYHFVHQTMLGAIPEDLRYKYRAQVQMGHAVYADVHSNTRGQAYPATFMTPEERARAMEWVVYHALKNSDRYVWFYTEKPQYLANFRVAPEMIPAIDRARGKVARNEEIGFDYLPLRDRATQAYNQAMFSAVEPSKAEIVRAVAPPKIDGQLDDETWKAASQLGPFQSFRTATEPLQTTTTAYLAYDETHLYIAFRCEDPARVKLHIDRIGFEDEPGWGGGSLVEVAIAADEEISKYYQIKVTPDNQTWDALTPTGVWPNEIPGRNSTWEGEYQTATHIGPGFSTKELTMDDYRTMFREGGLPTDVEKAIWSVEIAIPWATLNRPAPQVGDQIRANLIRRAGRRPPHDASEVSSWSLMVMNRHVEAKTFGTWEFK